MIVTIDGPAGTGKSTVARLLAERLGFEFLNTGSMYRAVALVCLERRLSPTDVETVGRLPAGLDMAFRANRLWLNGQDVSEAIRAAAVTEAASLVASNPQVRSQLVELQRRCGQGTNLVTEGRDQGTVVFPDAACKIFLTASPEERARRRQQELLAQGQDVAFELILADQRLRDERDETRECGPLRPAVDAVVIDTSTLSADAVLDRLEELARSRMPH